MDVAITPMYAVALFCAVRLLRQTEVNTLHSLVAMLLTAGAMLSGKSVSDFVTKLVNINDVIFQVWDDDLHPAYFFMVPRLLCEDIKEE